MYPKKQTKEKIMKKIILATSVAVAVFGGVAFAVELPKQFQMVNAKEAVAEHCKKYEQENDRLTAEKNYCYFQLKKKIYYPLVSKSELEEQTTKVDAEIAKGVEKTKVESEVRNYYTKQISDMCERLSGVSKEYCEANGWLIDTFGKTKIAEQAEFEYEDTWTAALLGQFEALNEVIIDAKTYYVSQKLKQEVGLEGDMNFATYDAEFFDEALKNKRIIKLRKKHDVIKTIAMYDANTFEIVDIADKSYENAIKKVLAEVKKSGYDFRVSTK